MNRREYLLTCLSEECAEVGQRVSKALRFGMSEIQPGQGLSNDDRICEELRDLLAVATILQWEGHLGRIHPVHEETCAKLRKIEKFMSISVREGTLTP